MRATLQKLILLCISTLLEIGDVLGTWHQSIPGTQCFQLPMISYMIVYYAAEPGTRQG